MAIAVVTLVGSCYALADARPAEVWSALEQTEVGWVVLGLVAMVAGLVARAARWRALFSLSTRPPLRIVWDVTLLTYFFNCILPARAGEAVRIVALKRRAATSQAETLGTVVMERAYDVGAVVVIFFAATPLLPETRWAGPAGLLGAALAAALIIVSLALLLVGERALAFTLRPLEALPWLSRATVERVATNFVRGLSAMREPRIALVGWAWTLVAWSATALSCWLVMLALRLDLPRPPACWSRLPVAWPWSSRRRQQRSGSSRRPSCWRSTRTASAPRTPCHTRSSSTRSTPSRSCSSGHSCSRARFAGVRCGGRICAGVSCRRRHRSPRTGRRR